MSHRKNPLHTLVRGGYAGSHDRANAALRATRLAGDRLLVMVLLLTVLPIAVFTAARRRSRKAIKGRSAVAQVAWAPAVSRCYIHSVCWCIECQVNGSPPEAGASCRTV